MIEEDRWFIEETLPNNLIVRCSKEYWDKIVKIKHPSMKNRLDDIKATLRDPDEIRVSKLIKDRILIYKQIGDGYICVVALTRENDLLITTTYFTQKVKEGEIIWKN
ncbi:MAG: DUF4258 domain-containing protein [Spirochaetota bacterium]|nr:DUF4258 domain-containing protein [Spirochaetota bacterium]